MFTASNALRIIQIGQVLSETDPKLEILHPRGALFVPQTAVKKNFPLTALID